MLFSRDSGIRLNERSYVALPPRPKDDRIFGELRLSHHGGHGFSSFAPVPLASSAGFHLVYAGDAGISVSPEHQHQLVYVNLVRFNASRTLIGHYSVEMLHQTDMFSVDERFVTHGRQTIPLTGDAKLEPGDFLGVMSAPLLRAPFGT